MHVSTTAAFLTFLPLIACAPRPNVEPAADSPAADSAATEPRPEDTEVWEPEPVLVTPGADAAPPSDAIVLFDGSDLSAWEALDGGEPGWKVEDGAMTVVGATGDIRTRQLFGSVQLHIEWRAPPQVDGEGQGRGNSGVFLMERYELQVLDSHDNRTYANGQAGSIYKQHAPLVNASRPPGEWQSWDIIFSAPRFDSAGALLQPAFMTVLHNGVLIQNHAELAGPTLKHWNTGVRGAPRAAPHPVPGSRQPGQLPQHLGPRAAVPRPVAPGRAGLADRARAWRAARSAGSHRPPPLSLPAPCARPDGPAAPGTTTPLRPGAPRIRPRPTPRSA